MDLRAAVLMAWDIWRFQPSLPGGFHKKLTDAQLLLHWGMQAGRMTSRGVHPVRVDELVKRWHQAIVGMATAHSRDDYDAHDFKADDLMQPLLTAPIRQVRQFWVRLQRSLRSDPQVPFFIWSSFAAWGKVVVKGACDDERALELRDQMAADIAAIVAVPVQDQLQEAIARALRWRDAETLGKVREALDAGAKPRMVGRQSCLFLEVGEGDQLARVML